MSECPECFAHSESSIRIDSIDACKETADQGVKTMNGEQWKLCGRGYIAILNLL
jgi:hypothetical protein